MATPALNKTYIISSVRHPNYSIDHWNKETNNGTNVILWSTDVNDTAMHWTYKNNRLYPVASNTHCLDRYISSLSDSNNADLWEDNDDNTQALEFINTGDDRFLIRLRNNNTLYLTAADTPSGANQDSNSKNSNGNVYWDTLPGGVETTKNLWTFREVGGPTDEHGEVFPAAKTYVVTNVKHSGYSLDHWNAETNDGTNVILYPTHKGAFPTLELRRRG